jgi:hypothetical protein
MPKEAVEEFETSAPLEPEVEAGDEPTFSAMGCTWVKGNTQYGPREVRTVDVESASGRPGRGRFQQDVNSTVTVGIAVKDSNGVWKASAGNTYSRSTSVGWTSASRDTPHRLYTNWYFRRYSFWCNGVKIGEEERIDAYHSRGRTADLVTSTYSNCSNLHDGEWWRSQSQAATYSAGATVNGVTVTSQSGFNSGVRLSFTFSASKKGRVCGNSAAGELAPRVRARA